MADTFYGVSIGVGLTDASEVLVQAATTGRGIELRTTDGAGLTIVKLLQALKAIEAKIATGDKPA